MRSFTLFVSFLCVAVLPAQSPVLVVDYNAGSANAGEGTQDVPSIYLNEDILFPLQNDAHGLELGILRNGELALLADLNPGQEDSDPRFLTNYNNAVYFVADSGEGDASVWRTDGTEAGTSIVFAGGDTGFTDPRGLIVSQEGDLYFTYDSDLYRSSDGENFALVYEGVNFVTNFSQASENYGRYADGIVFLTNSNSGFQLVYITQNDVQELVDISGSTGGSGVYGVYEVDGDVVFSISSFDEETRGDYRYDFGSGTFERYTVNGQRPSRVEALFTDRAMAWNNGEGYFTTDGITGNEELLIENTDFALVQGASVNLVTYNDEEAIFFSEGGTFGQDFLVKTEGEAASTTSVTEVDPFQSTLFEVDGYSFFATGVSNGFRPELFVYDFTTDGLTSLFEYDLQSLNINSVRFVGVQNNRLYYFSNLDTDVGLELYYLELDFDVNTPVRERNIFPYEVSIASTGFEIHSPEVLPLTVEVFTTDGRLINTRNGLTNTFYSTEVLRGVYVLRFLVDGRSVSYKVLR